MEGGGRDWRSILLAVGSIGGLLLMSSLSASMLAYALLEPSSPPLTGQTSRPLQIGLAASALILIGALFGTAAYYGVQRLRGRAVPIAAPRPLGWWQALLVLPGWPGSAFLAQFLIGKGPWQLFVPPLYLLAIAAPAYLLLRLTLGGLNAGSRLRVWGILCAGMTMATSIAIFAEAAFVILAAVVGGVFLALNPAQLGLLQRYAHQLGATSGVEEAVQMLKPLLENPLTLLLALLFFSGLTPFIEETSKSLAIWTVFDHLETPAQGFLAGALSGAGFGLFESLLAGATPDQSWAITLMIRGGSTMMHVAATGLTGWGIASFRLGRRLAPMLGAYAAAILLHALWNASVVTITFGSLKTAFSAGTPDAWAKALIILGAAVLIVLCAGMPIALAVINARLRLQSPRAAAASDGAPVY